MNRPFRQRSALKSWELQFGPNMTPMVDVVMVILIFFMAGTVLVGPEWFLKTALPTEAKGAGPAAPADPFALPPARFEIALDAGPDGRTIGTGLGQGSAELDELENRIRSLGSESSGAEVIVLIRPTAVVPYRDVVRVHSACVSAGIANVGLTDAPTP